MPMTGCGTRREYLFSYCGVVVKVARYEVDGEDGSAVAWDSIAPFLHPQVAERHLWKMSAKVVRS